MPTPLSVALENLGNHSDTLAYTRIRELDNRNDLWRAWGRIVTYTREQVFIEPCCASGETDGRDTENGSPV